MGFEPDYPLLTERLRLRPFMRGDVDAVFAYRQREDVAEFLFDWPMSREECAETVTQRIAQTQWHDDGDKIVLAAEWPEAGQLIGEVSLIWRSLEARQAEVGYIFNPQFHGKGFATEAANRLLKLAFEDLDIHRVMARCDARNVRSALVMERLGMRREAHFRQHLLVKGEWDEEFIYAILEDEWRERQGKSQLA
jgi:RimJ/RimL family protein N-acetyltransferase